MLSGVARGGLQIGGPKGILDRTVRRRTHQQAPHCISRDICAVFGVTAVLQGGSEGKGPGAWPVCGQDFEIRPPGRFWKQFLLGIGFGGFGVGLAVMRGPHGPRFGSKVEDSSTVGPVGRRASEVENTEVGVLSESEAEESTNGAGAGRDASCGRVTLVSGASSLPHPDKVHRGGEDASFIADNGLAVGVADGVGAWALSGIDAGVYAKQLMANARDAVPQFPAGPSAPREVLRMAHSKSTALGSSTACVLYLDSRARILHAANLGDSGFLVVRNGESIFKSPVQTWNFNCPYQLGRDTRSYNSPEDAEAFAIRVQPGDVIVAATDGVFDNLFTDDCVKIVDGARKKGLTAAQASKALADAAFEIAKNRRAVTPFSLEAQANGVPYYGGGKMDDITVVVSYVTAISKL